MIRRFIFSSFTFGMLTCFFSSCSFLTSSPKEEKHQLELSLHKLRTDVEDVKHDLNTYEIEHHVLEGKLIDQTQMICAIKDQVAQFKQGKLQSLIDQLEQLEKTLEELTAKHKQTVEDIRQLSAHANGTTTALSQYKLKIGKLEKTMTTQQTKIEEILRLKQKITDLATEVGASNDQDHKEYTVKSGDSLGKIAKQFGLSVEAIKELNHLTNDRIHPGQTLRVPKRSQQAL